MEFPPCCITTLSQLNDHPMLRNYFTTAFRNLALNKGFTLINILGLALGLSIFLLIVFYVEDEIHYDRYNTRVDRIFRINTDVKFGNSTISFAQAGPPMATALVKEFPEVEKAIRIAVAQGNRFKIGDEQVLDDKGAYADPGIFDVFTLPMIEGDPATALQDPHSMVITESAAKKFFNHTKVIGQTISIADDSIVHVITGVIRDIPRQSHFNIDFFLSMNALPGSRDNRFNSINFNTYVLLRPGTRYQNLEAKFPAFLRKALEQQGWDMNAFEKSGNYLKMNMTPLPDIHLRSDRTRELGLNSDIQYVYIFSAIALFILFIACSNFINLSTARSANRAREVGVRKVLGSSRADLVARFLSESLLLTLAATILAITIAWALLPLFNSLSGKQLTITSQTVTAGWLWLIIIIAVVGLLAGSYPAFFLSSFQPVDVLKSRLTAGFKGGGLRSFLVVFQFSISIFLVIGTGVIYNQLHYIRNKSLGYNRNQVLVVRHTGTLDNPKTFRQEIRQLPGVADASLSSFLPTDTKRWPNFISTGTTDLQVDFWAVDEEYIPTMGMSMKKGRNFSTQFPTDSTAVILNEAAASALGFSNDPLNKTLYHGEAHKPYHVIGIVNDFNFNSLRQHITPLVMWPDNDQDALIIRINTTNMRALLTQVEKEWKKIAPHREFEYSFMDEDFGALYRTEQRMGQLFIIFTSLAIGIACLGLFGLATYAAEQRSREMAIRKVLGAGVSTLVTLLSKDFLRLITLSIGIATPLAWFVMQKWLQGFAYRQEMQWWIAAWAAIGALAIALATISYQSMKAAIANPIKSLRSE
jgi:putative ABC transport system permease protein